MTSRFRFGVNGPPDVIAAAAAACYAMLFCLTLPSTVFAQQWSAGCDFYQDVASGQSYAIYSPNYGNPYPDNIRCRWTLATTPGSRVALYCQDVVIPQSTSCVNDRLLISTGGKQDLSDARVYCGTGTIATVESSGSAMVVSLQVPVGSRGGRFYCTATKLDCKCGLRKKKKIVGGTETLVNEFPMLAALVDASGGGIFCGATIVTNYHAITAAHCPLGRQLSNLGLLVGEHDITSGSDSPYTALLRVASIKTHEQYSTVTSQNDIAIVRTQTEILFTAGIGPACLPFKYQSASFVGVELEAAGWGSTDFGSPKSNVPMKVDLPVVDPNRCYQTYKNFATAGQLCTWNSGKDTCQSDSGGPLFYTDYYNGLVYLTGVVSYGMACATNDPSVSTRITQYMGWIMQNTPEWTYCYQ